MVTPDWDPTQFRRFLIRKLAETSWSSRFKDDTIENIARHLGVQTDVLLDAQRYSNSLTERATSVAGLAPIKVRHNGQRIAVGHQMTVQIRTPELIRDVWNTHCSLGGYTDPVLLRSIIHFGLMRPEQPYWLGFGWPYKGSVYHCKGVKTGTWPWWIRTRIAAGAKAALIRRARASRIAIQGFVRGLVLDLLVGRIQSFDTITEVSQMFEADRYFTLEGTLEARALAQQTMRKKS